MSWLDGRGLTDRQIERRLRGELIKADKAGIVKQGYIYMMYEDDECGQSLALLRGEDAPKASDICAKTMTFRRTSKGKWRRVGRQSAPKRT